MQQFEILVFFRFKLIKVIFFEVFVFQSLWLSLNYFRFGILDEFVFFNLSGLENYDQSLNNLDQLNYYGF